MNSKRQRIFSFSLLIFFVVLLANFGTCLQDTENPQKSGKKEYPYMNVILPFIKEGTTYEQSSNLIKNDKNLLEAKQGNVQTKETIDDNHKGLYIGLGVLVVVVVIILVIVICCCCSCTAALCACCACCSCCTCCPEPKSKEKQLKRALKKSRKLNAQDIEVQHVNEQTAPMELKVDLNLEPSASTSQTQINPISNIHQVQVHALSNQPHKDEDLQKELMDHQERRKPPLESYDRMVTERRNEPQDGETSKQIYVQDSFNTKKSHQDTDPLAYSQNLPSAVYEPYNVNALHRDSEKYKNKRDVNNDPRYRYVVEELKTVTEDPKFTPKYQSSVQKIDSFEQYSGHSANTTDDITNSKHPEVNMQSTTEKPNIMPKPQSFIKKDDSIDRRYISSEMKPLEDPQLRRQYSLEKGSYNQSQNQRYNSPERESYSHPQKQRYNSFETKSYDQVHEQIHPYNQSQNFKNDYSSNNPREQSSDFEHSSKGRSNEQKKFVPNSSLHEERRYSDDRQREQPNTIIKHSSFTNETVTKTSIPMRTFSDRDYDRHSPKIDYNISIPDPDYLTPSQKKYDLSQSTLNDDADHRPKIPPKPEPKFRDFKRPYGIEDLDDMNNPLTIALRQKQVRNAPIDFNNPEF